MSDSSWPMDCSPPGSSVHGILQARTLEWVAVPSSRGSSRLRGQTQVSCTAGFFTLWGTREAQVFLRHSELKEVPWEFQLYHWVESSPHWVTDSHVEPLFHMKIHALFSQLLQSKGCEQQLPRTEVSSLESLVFLWVLSSEAILNTLWKEKEKKISFFLFQGVFENFLEICHLEVWLLYAHCSRLYPQSNGGPETEYSQNPRVRERQPWVTEPWALRLAKAEGSWLAVSHWSSPQIAESPQCNRKQKGLDLIFPSCLGPGRKTYSILWQGSNNIPKNLKRNDIVQKQNKLMVVMGGRMEGRDS